MLNLFKNKDIQFLQDAMNTVHQQILSIGQKIQTATNKGDELSRSYQALLSEFNVEMRRQNKFNLSVKNELEDLRALISTLQGVPTGSTQQPSVTTPEELVAVVPELTKAVRKARVKKEQLVVSSEKPAKKVRERKPKA